MELKGDNEGSIFQTHNLVFYARTKYIKIKHYYIHDKVATKKFELFYIPTNQMIVDGLTNLLTYIKFHGFVQQIHIT